jgi:hypothetical protein
MTGAIGNCIDEKLVEEIFGSVSEFARQIELYGSDNFFYNDIEVVYDKNDDIHWFFERNFHQKWVLPRDRH